MEGEGGYQGILACTACVKLSPCHFTISQGVPRLLHNKQQGSPCNRGRLRENPIEHPSHQWSQSLRYAYVSYRRPQRKWTKPTTLSHFLYRRRKQPAQNKQSIHPTRFASRLYQQKQAPGCAERYERTPIVHTDDKLRLAQNLRGHMQPLAAE